MKIGTDAALGLGVARLLIEAGAVNRDFVREQTDLPQLVRAWVPARVPFGTAVYTNGMVSGATSGPVFTIPFVLPWVGGSWRLDLVFWSALIGVIAVLFAALGPRTPEAPASVMAVPFKVSHE